MISSPIFPRRPSIAITGRCGSTWNWRARGNTFDMSPHKRCRPQHRRWRTRPISSMPLSRHCSSNTASFPLLARWIAWLRSLKVTHLAQEARSLYPSDLLDFSAPRRFTLLICLIHQATVSTRDEIIQMFLKRIARLTEKAKQELERLREEERAITEHLVEMLADIVQASVDAKDLTEG